MSTFGNVFHSKSWSQGEGDGPSTKEQRTSTDTSSTSSSGHTGTITGATGSQEKTGNLSRKFSFNAAGRRRKSIIGSIEAGMKLRRKSRQENETGSGSGDGLSVPDMPTTRSSSTRSGMSDKDVSPGPLPGAAYTYGQPLMKENLSLTSDYTYLLAPLESRASTDSYHSDLSKVSTFGPTTEDLLSTVSAAQSWLDNYDSSERVTDMDTVIPATGTMETRHTSASTINDEDSPPLSTYVVIKSKAKAKSPREVIPLREDLPVNSLNSKTSKLSRTRSSVLRSPPPPEEKNKDRPSMPNVDVSHMSHSPLKKQQQSMTANVIYNVKRRLSIGKERKAKETADVSTKNPDQVNSRGFHVDTEKGKQPTGTRVSGTRMSEERRKSTGQENRSGSALRPAVSQTRRIRSPSLKLGSHLDSPPALPVNIHAQAIPPVPPVPRKHSTLVDKKPSTSRNSSASSGHDEKGTLRRKISRGSSIGDTEESDSNSRNSRNSRSSRNSRTSRQSRTEETTAVSQGKLQLSSESSRTNRLSKTETIVPPPRKESITRSNVSAANMPQLLATDKQKNGVRRRGKTLPGNLAAPPPIPITQLPPMKMEPLPDLNIVPKPALKTRTSRITPTRLPIPKPPSDVTSVTPFTSGTSSEDEVIHSDGARRARRRKPQSRISQRKSGVTPPSDSSTTTSPKTRPRSTHRSTTAIESVSHRKIPSRKQSLPPIVRTGHSSVENEILVPPPAPEIRPTKPKMATLNRTTSLHAITTASETETTKERRRAISLHEKLQAKAAQSSVDNSDNIRPSTNLGSRTPKSPHTALKYYVQHLTMFEQVEIRDHSHVYFFGPRAQKVAAVPQMPDFNHGYDDERGDYKIVLQDHLLYRYEVLEVLGQGSFGQVVKCVDHKTGDTVAVKLIRNKKRFHAQALTEIKILKQLVEWDPEDRYHNIRMLNYFNFRNHLCVVFECLSMNLYDFIKSNNFQGFSLSLIRRFTVQILESLCLLYDHRVIHCDLKPENILLKHPSKSTIKVIDFGSSCFVNERVYTYIQSRFYRAPEVILGISYGMAIDMWSLGCILAELYTGRPIFPGENEQQQLACIMEILGVPDRYLIERSTRKSLFFDSTFSPRIVPNSKGKKRYPKTKSILYALRCNDMVFIDFIERCLQWDPDKRMKPYEALQHEWITQRAAPVAVLPRSDSLRR